MNKTLRMQTNLFPGRGIECPVCHVKLMEASALTTAPEGRNPKPGDVSVCAHCGACLVFDEPPVMHAIRFEEWMALPKDVSAKLTEMQEWARGRHE